MTMATISRAFVRGVAATFADALNMAQVDKHINVPLARQQHAGYVALLQKLVPPRCVHVIPPDDQHPDCCFIEDTAVVVLPDAVVISRPGAPSRSNETSAVADTLQRVLQADLKHIQGPGTLEGGDVLRMGRHLLAGLTTRTNAQGVQQLQQHLGPSYTVHPVPVPAGLHLKSAVTALDDSTILYSADAAGRGIVSHLQQLPHLADAAFIEVPDAAAANVLSLGPTIVMQGGCKETEGLIASLCKERRLTLHKLPRMTEFVKADGSLTCLSILC